MGAAAYERGSRAISQQIDLEMAGKRPAMDARMERQMLREQVERLTQRAEAAEADLVRAKALIERLRVYRENDRQQFEEQLAGERRRFDIMRDIWKGARENGKAGWKRAEWLRGLCSFAGVTVEQRDAYERSIAE